MDLSLAGNDFRRSQKTKGFYRRNGRKIQDGSACLEGSRRDAADDQRWGCWPRTVLFCGILDRFLIEQKQEQDAEQITHSTLASYRSMISQHILPKWGDTYLKTFAPPWYRIGFARSPLAQLQRPYSITDVPSLRQGHDLGPDRRRSEPDGPGRSEGHQQAPETSAHSPGEGCLANTRRIGSALPNHRADWLCFGLRISEILGLRWTDFDFKRSAVLIQRSAVGKRLNKLKTECSQDEVPLERGFIVELKKWQALCLDPRDNGSFPVR